MLDTSGKFINNKCYIITGNNLKFLTAVLNSKVAKKWILDNCPPLGNRGRELNKVFFEGIPIPQIPLVEQEPFERFVDAIIDQLTKGFNPCNFEKNLNELVYKLYRLSDNEIKVVEAIS